MSKNSERRARQAYDLGQQLSEAHEKATVRDYSIEGRGGIIQALLGLFRGKSAAEKAALKDQVRKGYRSTGQE